MSCKWPRGFAWKSSPSFRTLRWRIKFTSVDIDRGNALALVRRWGWRQRGGGDKDRGMNERWPTPCWIVVNMWWMHPMHQALFWVLKNPLLNSVTLWVGTICVPVIRMRKPRLREINCCSFSFSFAALSSWPYSGVPQGLVFGSLFGLDSSSWWSHLVSWL